MFDLGGIFDGVQSFLSQIFGFYTEIIDLIFGGLLGGIL